MNIRKIIKEEVDDFEWVGDIMARDELINNIKSSIINNPKYHSNGGYLNLEKDIPYSIDYPLSRRARLMVKVHGFDLFINEIWDTDVSIIIWDNSGEGDVVDNDSQPYEVLPHEILTKIYEQLWTLEKL